jgi:CheY-like chemotaxis protein
MSSAARILVVDDEESIRTFVEGALTYAGYSVVCARDGHEALRIVEQQGSFDLYLLDLAMPQMDGDEVARRVCLTDPDARVLYLTGYVDRLFERRATLWANEAFLEKPTTLDALLEAVSLMLTGRIQKLRTV